MPGDVTRALWCADDVWFDDSFCPSIDVHEPDYISIDTGLVDADGNRIMGRPYRAPIGFMRRDG